MEPRQPPATCIGVTEESMLGQIMFSPHINGIFHILRHSISFRPEENTKVYTFPHLDLNTKIGNIKLSTVA